MRTVIWAFTAFALSGCRQNAPQHIDVLTTLPQEIREASACAVTQNPDLVWTVEDQNNAPLLFGFNRKGELIKKIPVLSVKNNDWEDLSSDADGNLYIGDFGNNDNERRDLAIYKIKAADLNKNQAAVAQRIQFYYPDQQEFPPKNKDFIFDAEAFLYADNQFYIFTKNRSSAFDGTTALYRVKNVGGERVAAQKISTFVTCGKYKGCAVTGAAISPDHTKVAILSSDKVWVFTGFKGDDFFSGKVQQIDLQHYSQKEGLCFEDNNTLLITDEGGKNDRSKLYRLRL